jgi:epoxyqueuosine reductase
MRTPTRPPLTPPEAAAAIKSRAVAEGFDTVRLTTLPDDALRGERLDQFLALGHHGQMGWMAETSARRRHPRALWSGARSAVVLGLNYGPDHDPMSALAHRDLGVISVYAQGRDYHDVVKKRLKALGGWMATSLGGELKVFVDTAPLMEKPLAAQSGLGWQGKHTNLVSRTHGSWLFLGVILTTLDLPADPPEADHCGSCRACLDICPTAAFPAPYQLDARRCISYLTIEHRGPVPEALRPALGNRIYGCDDCLAVCPWNKFAQAAAEQAFHPRDGLTAPRLADLAALDDAGFRVLFAGSPVKRIGRDRFVRNVAYALGNSEDTAAVPVLVSLCHDDDETVRDAAHWALHQLAEPVPDRETPSADGLFGA